MAATCFFYKRSKKKNSCIGKKCWNDVQKFTSTKISGEFRISGGIPPAICMEETLPHDGKVATNTSNVLARPPKMRQTPQRCRRWGYGNCHLRSSEGSRTVVCGQNVHDNSASVTQKRFISSHYCCWLLDPKATIVSRRKPPWNVLSHKPPPN